MKTNHPIQAKNTYRLLKSVLPESFKIVNDNKSNGYKFINLLYGAEIDELRDRLKTVYNDSSLALMEYKDNSIFEVTLSGIPQSDILNTSVSGVSIKIVDADEFYNGDPTRIIPTETISISGLLQGLGIEYFRTDERCSGYLLINNDFNQTESYISGIYPSLKVFVDSNGSVVGISGFYSSIIDQSYESRGIDELLTPPDSGSLYRQFPLERTVLDENGVSHNIDYYEPYYGWIYNHNSGVIANTSKYTSDFYYDENGNKIYYRVAYNNPYGYNNYTNTYLTLQHIPISGTLKLYDIDVLNASGNATEIPQSGIVLYTKQPSGTHGPIYMGYDRYVPNDIQFGSIAGYEADVVTTTSWDYVKEGSYKNENTLQWIDSASGEITNIIKIVNPMSRYIVEYKYSDFDKAKYITSTDSLKNIRLDTYNPIYTLESNNNLSTVDYKFTSDPRWNSPASGFYKTMVLTFDGWRVRPGSRLSEVKLSIPVETFSGKINSYNLLQSEYNYIGYTNEFVPDYTPNREYIFSTNFNAPIISGYICTEQSSIGSGLLNFESDNNNYIYKFPYKGQYYKKIVNISGDTQYTINSFNFLKPNTFIKIKFKKDSINDFTLLEVSDSIQDKYFRIDVKSNGDIIINSNSKFENDLIGTSLVMNGVFAFGIVNELIIHYTTDEESTNRFLLNTYLKSGTSKFTKLDYFEQYKDTYNVTSSSLILAKNCSIDLFSFDIYYEDIEWL